MTFGRPPTIPNEYMRLDLPMNHNLEKLTIIEGSTASTSPLDPPDTVCFFIATMYVWPLSFMPEIHSLTSPSHADNSTISSATFSPNCMARTSTLTYS